MMKVNQARKLKSVFNDHCFVGGRSEDFFRDQKVPKRHQMMIMEANISLVMGPAREGGGVMTSNAI